MVHDHCLAASGWVHPFTFATWSPLFIELYWTGIRPASSAMSMCRDWAVLTVLLVIGLVASAVEVSGLLPQKFRVGPEYWALTRIKLFHTVFWMSKFGSLFPLRYLSAVSGLLVLAQWHGAQDLRVRTFNRPIALFGIGVWLAYTLCVETHLLFFVASWLPLRFDGVLFTFLLANALSLVVDKSGKPSVRMLAAVYFIFLISSSFQTFHWSIVWAIATVWHGNRERSKITVCLAVFSALLITVSYILLVPDNMDRIIHAARLGRAIDAMGGLVVLGPLFLLCSKVKQVESIVLWIMLGVGTCFTSLEKFPQFSLRNITNDARALSGGQIDRSPTAEALAGLTKTSTPKNLSSPNRAFSSTFLC